MTYVNAASMSAVGVLFPVLAVLALAVRVYGWRYHSPIFEVDDVLVIPACALTVAAGVALVIRTQTHLIGANSQAESTAAESLKLGKFEYALWIGHVLAIGLIKLTILFMFRRLFKGRAYRTAFDYANWILVTLVALWTVAFLFLDIFACGATPSASWESWNSLRNACIDTFGMQTGCAVFSWVLDLAIFVEPLVMIRTLNMNKKRKIQTSLVFLCSGFAVVAGLLRMILWIQATIQDITRSIITVLGTTFPISDQQGIISVVLFWTYIEIGIGFLVACVPRSAWVLDKVSLGPVLSKLRLLPSSVSLLTKKYRRSPRGGKDDMGQTQGSWATTLQPEPSWGHRSNDDVGLVAVNGRV
ncbi:hypothetical protein GGS23DRAFT_560048 [Durotheca rogersii]|uniref:uncharacterized protein n=1 Tax=Durotheca rogersii TaxID=419775 RepID=UPI00221E76C3|nr:uncharacterized protein GGS23DRAFT_560048 [Durotheca rogersii]KAI5865621.1 hypothetical protein GGS23DRAFT_560048 [Durotheca rogersii]